jgi:hypothetical protein
MPKDNTSERIELYKVYVDTTSKTSETRVKINTFFVSINTLIIGSGSFLNPTLLLLFGICINFLWVELIKSYRDLNNAKFQVIHEIEQELCHKCFKREQEIYQTIKRRSVTTIEKWLPYLIMIFYGIMAIYKNWQVIKTIIQSICCCQ